MTRQLASFVSLSFTGLLVATACGMPIDEPPAADGSETTDAVDPTTSAGSVSASSTSTSTGVPPATSTTTVDPTTADDTTEDTGFVFLLEPDGGSCVGEGEHHWYCSYCDLPAQDCPDGEKCMPWANDGGPLWNATRCSPVVDDPAAVGEPCTVEGSQVSGFDDCELGALCWEVDPRTLQGTCVAFCDQHEVMPCAEGQVCVYDDVLPVNVCMPWCDPLDPGSCGPGQTCRQAMDDEVACVPDVALPDGVPCEDGSCGQEAACMRAQHLAACDEAVCCSPWCDLSAPDPDLACTQAGEVCRPFHDDGAPVGLTHVGVCGLPL